MKKKRKITIVAVLEADQSERKTKQEKDSIFFQSASTGNVQKLCSGSSTGEGDVHSHCTVTNSNRLLQSAALSSEFN